MAAAGDAAHAAGEQGYDAQVLVGSRWEMADRSAIPTPTRLIARIMHHEHTDKASKHDHSCGTDPTRRTRPLLPVSRLLERSSSWPQSYVECFDRALMQRSNRSSRLQGQGTGLIGASRDPIHYNPYRGWLPMSGAIKGSRAGRQASPLPQLSI